MFSKAVCHVGVKTRAFGKSQTDKTYFSLTMEYTYISDFLYAKIQYVDCRQCYTQIRVGGVGKGNRGVNG